MHLIRPSHDGDVAAITAIYAHHVLHGTGTFETEPPPEADMRVRRADVLGKGLPYLVAEVDGRVIGKQGNGVGFAFRGAFLGLQVFLV